jgi:hypothetical protein
MSVQLVQSYLVAPVGLVIAAVAGFAATRRARRVERWDANLTLPLLMGVAAAHLVLIPVVELERQAMFGLYVASVIVVVGLAFAGRRIWRLGAVLLPVGSVLGYAYFAVLAHQADYVGLTIKLVELATIAAAAAPVVRRGQARDSRATAA